MSQETKLKALLKPYLDDIVFIEFSKDYISKSKDKLDFMKKIPVPLKKEQAETLEAGGEVKPEDFSAAMVYVIGADPEFKYRKQYMEYMNVFNPQSLKFILKNALDLATNEELELAAIYIRAAYLLDENSLDVEYNYARICKHLADQSTDTKLIQELKEQSRDLFKNVTEKHPKFAQAHYFLGYAYVNEGRYMDAEEIWQKYIKLNTGFKNYNGKDKKEIRQRLEQIQRPIQAEKAMILIDRGHMQEGIDLLVPLMNDEPKWLYRYSIGVAYFKLAQYEKAIEYLKESMNLRPANPNTLSVLVECYKALGDKENETKYQKKLRLVKE